MSISINGLTGISGVDGTSGTPVFKGNDTNTGISFGTDTVTINTGGVARVTTDASGNVGVGVTPSAWDAGYKAFQISPQAAISTYSGASQYAYFTVNSYGSSTGEKYIGSGNASKYEQSIGRHIWFTAPSGTAGNAISFTQAMSLDASGNLLVGTTSVPTAGTNGISVQTAGQPIIRIARSGTSGQTHMQFMNSNDIVGSITTSGSTTSYGTSSDYRLKENIAPMTGALATVAALKPCTYTWKADGSAGQGFIAHELQAIVPDCVTGEKDAVDEDGKPKYQGVDTSFLVATLVSAIQEQQTIIQSLTSRLEALENK